MSWTPDLNIMNLQSHQIQSNADFQPLQDFTSLRVVQHPKADS